MSEAKTCSLTLRHMTTRTTRRVVTFNHAFTLNGIEGALPPGCYMIETEEEPLDSMSITAYRRLATTITLPAIGTISLRKQLVTIDPEDLIAAQRVEIDADKMTRARVPA